MSGTSGAIKLKLDAPQYLFSTPAGYRLACSILRPQLPYDPHDAQLEGNAKYKNSNNVQWASLVIAANTILSFLSTLSLWENFLLLVVDSEPDGVGVPAVNTGGRMVWYWLTFWDYWWLCEWGIVSGAWLHKEEACGGCNGAEGERNSFNWPVEARCRSGVWAAGLNCLIRPWNALEGVLLCLRVL